MIEERKDIELHEIETFVRIEVAQDSEARRQDVVIEDACLCRRNRGCGGAVEPGNQIQAEAG